MQISKATKTNPAQQEEQRHEQILSQSDKLGGVIIPQSFDETARNLASRAIGESFIFGFRLAMLVAAALAFGGALVSYITILRQVGKRIPRTDSPDSIR